MGNHLDIGCVSVVGTSRPWTFDISRFLAVVMAFSPAQSATNRDGALRALLSNLVVWFTSEAPTAFPGRHGLLATALLGG